MSLSFPHATSIADLASELLGHIFSLAIHNNPDAYDTIIHAILISHVCRRWRHIALNKSSLWTTIMLNYRSPSSQLSRTITYMSRSGTHPLDIFLDFRDPQWDWQEESHGFRWNDMEVYVRLLSPHVHRWRIFELLCDTWSPVYTLLWYMRKVESAPMLQSISLSRCNIYFVGIGQSFQPVFMKEPIAWFAGGSAFRKLHKVALAGVHIDWAHSGLKNLTQLELRYHAKDVMPSLQVFSTILLDCPALSRLSIIGWGLQFESAAQSSSITVSHVRLRRSITLSQLKYFAIGYIDVEYAVELLQLFCFPVLEVLALEDISPTIQLLEHQDASSIMDFLMTSHAADCPSREHTSSCCTSRCFPLSKIRSLELRGVQAGEATLSRFLRGFDALKRLFVANSGTEVFIALDRIHSIPISHSSIYPCPQLSEIVCQLVDTTALLILIESRWPAEKIPLPHILLDTRGGNGSISSESKLALVNAGVEIVEDELLVRRPSLLLSDYLS